MSPIWTPRHVNVPKLFNHTSTAVGHIIYFFGGYFFDDYDGKRPILVQSYNTNTLQCSSISFTYDSLDDVPFNRYGNTVVADGYTIYLWGGGNFEHACNELFAFNCQTLKWSRPKVS